MPPAQKPPARPPSETMLAAVSVAIILYLVGLVLTIMGNSVSGASPLVRTIKGRLFTPWLAPAWLDLGFDHPLTYGRPEDGDHLLVIGEFEPSGGGSKTDVRLPGERRGERAARWRRLARRTALAAVEDAAAPLAAGIGIGGFDLVGNDDVEVRILRRLVGQRDDPPGPPRLSQTYAARVRRVDGDLQLIELGGEDRQSELAPIIPPADLPDDEASR